MPLKVPAYRQGRAHTAFLCRLKDYFPQKEQFHLKCLEAIKQQFHVVEVELEDIADTLQQDHRTGTFLIDDL